MVVEEATSNSPLLVETVMGVTSQVVRAHNQDGVFSGVHIISEGAMKKPAVTQVVMPVGYSCNKPLRVTSRGESS